MMRSLLVAACLAGCSPSGADGGCDEGLCESAFTVTLAPSSGDAIAPGFYTFDLRFDAERTNEDCVVFAPPRGPQCNGGWVTGLQRELATTGFQIKGPAAQRVSVSVRGLCAERPLVAATFEPTYACATGCRSAATTLAWPSAGFAICDAGTD